MNLETLRIFCDVVRTQSFSRGASANHVSQSAASQAVHQLEKHFGQQLIDRTKRPFLMTPEGQVCYEGCREVLERFDSVEAHMRSLKKDIAGVVRVAAIYSVGLHDMSRCMQDFIGRYPKAKVRLEYLRPNKVYEAVLNEEADLGVVSYPVATHGLTSIPWRMERMVLVCHPEHYLSKLKVANPTNLRGETFIAFDRDLIIRKELDRFFRQHQVAIKIAMEFDNIETIKQAVEIGAGISILPEPTVRREVSAGTLAAVPLSAKTLRRPVGIIHRQRKLFTPAIARFIELLKSTASGAEPSKTESGPTEAGTPE